MTKALKIFGIQRSGTNVLEWLLSHNYDVKVPNNADSGWRHGHYMVPEVYGEEIDLVVISKHPLVWLPSGWRWFSAHGNGFWDDWKNWLRRSEGIEAWNARYHNWLDVKLATHRKVVVRYMDIFTAPAVQCRQIADLLSLEPIVENFVRPKARVGCQAEETGTVFKREYYDERKFLNYFHGDDRAFVEGRVDWTMAARLGHAKGDW